MGKNSRRPRGWLSQALLPENKVNKEFKDNQERFMLFNRMFKKPGKFMLNVGTLISIVLTIVPVCFPNAIYNTTTIAFLVSGIVITIGFEQTANIHYYRYAAIANNKFIDSIKMNIRINQVLRFITLTGWVISMFALVMMILTKNGSLSEIW